MPRHLRREVPGRLTHDGRERRPLDLERTARRSSTSSAPRASRRSRSASCMPTPIRRTRRRCSPRVRELWPEVSVGRVAPDHARVARVRADEHGRPVGVRAARRRALSDAALRRARAQAASTGSSTSCSRTAASTRVEKTKRDPDHDGRVRPRERVLGRGRARAPDRRAERARARHRRHDGEVLADRGRPREDHHRLLDRAQPPLRGLPDHGAGRRPGRDRQRRRQHRLGRRLRQAPRRAAVRRRGARPGVLRARRHGGDDHRREPRARADQPRLLLRRRDRRRHGGRGNALDAIARKLGVDRQRRRAASCASPTTTWSTR